VFVQNKFEASHWIVSAGLRYDHFNTFGDTVNPRISAAYKIGLNQKIRASYGRGFRAPSAGDLAFPYYGNPDLKPEKSRSWEIGYERFWNGLEFTGSWFHNDYDDLITFDPNTFIAGNVANAMTQGLELSASYELHGWIASGSYTYLDTEDEATGLRLFRRPKHSVTFRASYEAEKWGVSAGLVGLGNRLETDFSVFPSTNVLNEGFGKLDLAAHYRILKSLNLRGRIENVTDSDYQEILGFPSPGISFYGGIEFEL
jgi:vitamin B12 transporter